ncbi:hypothetical protein BH09BAC2_BH09BAC2_19740 [soil metagenome]
MEKMNDLRDLLRHEIMDLYSVEEQIIEALPQMIQKAGNANLKKLLQEHLTVTKKQKGRLDKVKQILGEEKPDGEGQFENKGLFSRLFGGGEQKCKGMEGILKEGQKIMSEDMNPEVLDAAIIGAAQKVEHYEICGYGTARAYSRELMLDEITQLLEASLNEEYDADDNLTVLAVGRLNVEAELAAGDLGDDTPLKQRKSVGRSNTDITRGQNKNNKFGGSSKSGNKSYGSKGGSSAKASSTGGRGGSSSKGVGKGRAGKSSGAGKDLSEKGSNSRHRSSSSSKVAGKGATKRVGKEASKSETKGAYRGASNSSGNKSAAKGKSQSRSGR